MGEEEGLRRPWQVEKSWEMDWSLYWQAVGTEQCCDWRPSVKAVGDEEELLRYLKDPY